MTFPSNWDTLDIRDKVIFNSIREENPYNIISNIRQYKAAIVGYYKYHYQCDVLTREFLETLVIDWSYPLSLRKLPRILDPYHLADFYKWYITNHPPIGEPPVIKRSKITIFKMVSK